MGLGALEHSPRSTGSHQLGFVPWARTRLASVRRIAASWVRSAGSCQLALGPRDRTSLASVRGIAPDWVRSSRSYQVCPPKKLGRAAAATDLTDRSDRSDQTRRPAKVSGRERPALDRLCVMGGLPEFPTGDSGRGVFGRAGRLIAVKGGTIGSKGAPAAPSPDRPPPYPFFCVICVNSVTALSGNGLRRPLLKSLRHGLRHSRSP